MLYPNEDMNDQRRKGGLLLRSVMTTLFTVAFILLFCTSIFAAEPYKHTPMGNPKAASDIVEDSDAVYGYAPSPESTRLKEYVEYDWTDEKIVNEMREQRESYHESMQELYDMIDSMKAEDKDIEEIARAISTRRNELRLEAYKDDPEGLEKVKKSNLENFGDENGGSPDYFYEKYGDWETVLEKALSTNAGADACLGLYDKYYDTYEKAGGSAAQKSQDRLAQLFDGVNTSQKFMGILSCVSSLIS